MEPINSFISKNSTDNIGKLLAYQKLVNKNQKHVDEGYLNQL